MTDKPITHRAAPPTHRISESDIAKTLQDSIMRIWRPDTVFTLDAPTAYDEARKKVETFLLTVDPATDWADVIGNEAAREALSEAIEAARTNPELYAHYGMTAPRGVLLYGPPGCGKTMFAKAAAAAVGRAYSARAEVLIVNGPQIQSPYVGRTEETIRNIFAFAREYADRHGHPLTVFIDEAETILPDRTGKGRPVSGWEQSQGAQFLTELDGMNRLGAFVILATNRPEAIDEAALRDGRCDRKIRIERPDRKALALILEKSLAGAPAKAPLDMLVMAGAEAFFDPHLVIHEGHVIMARLGSNGIDVNKIQAVNFCLEHIVSGAMAVSAVRRAKALAFARDRAAGTTTGIDILDMINAVKAIHEENRKLEHSFALREFVERLPIAELQQPTAPIRKAH